ncbi:hypothetical protein ACFSTE_05100 [Aquimarina hainanensis]|uniref:Gliding motility-associated protein GldM N-terminal domain-containing protein n=1 Tax=Aquimarina hainanensis TaxID=1578017 RepID=A0ABW5N7M5_9FLAO
MKSKYTLLRLLIVLICFNSYAQEKDDCNTKLKKTLVPFINSLNKANEVYRLTIKNYQDVINDKVQTLNELNSAQPEKYGDLKSKSDKVKALVSELNEVIESFKDEAKADYFDHYNYEMMIDTLFYRNILFDNENNLSKRGLALKEKIQYFHEVSMEVLNSSQEELKNYNVSKFDTKSSFRDYDGNPLDFINFHLSDTTVIGVLSFFEKLQLEVITFQYLYMNSIIQ